MRETWHVAEVEPSSNLKEEPALYKSEFVDGMRFRVTVWCTHSQEPLVSLILARALVMQHAWRARMTLLKLKDGGRRNKDNKFQSGSLEANAAVEVPGQGMRMRWRNDYTRSIDVKLFQFRLQSLPAKREQEVHLQLTRLPYQGWCQQCAATRAREDARTQSERGDRKGRGRNVISFDFGCAHTQRQTEG